MYTSDLNSIEYMVLPIEWVLRSRCLKIAVRLWMLIRLFPPCVKQILISSPEYVCNLPYPQVISNGVSIPCSVFYLGRILFYVSQSTQSCIVCFVLGFACILHLFITCDKTEKKTRVQDEIKWHSVTFW